MKIIDVKQGSPEWHQHRAAHFNASDAAAMMGASKYKTREQLMHEIATGTVKEVDSFTQQRFDRGHETEAAIRPHIELMIGEDIYPVVGVSEEHPRLSASYDGLNMAQTITMEHKLWNEALAEKVRDGSIIDDPAYFWQMEQQILVGCEKVLFVVSDGTPEKYVSIEYTAQPGRAEQLIEGWKYFEQQLSEYKAPEPVIEVCGKAPDALPALRIEVTGMVTASNLEEFKNHAIAVFKGINKDLKTDEDFADGDKTAKWCREVTIKLKAAKQHALSQTESIDRLFRAIDDITAEADRVAIDLEKLIKARKEIRKNEIINEASAKLSKHIADINETIRPLVMPVIKADFSGATKNLKSFSSMQDKVDGELTRAKIEASQVADLIRKNQLSLRELAKDHSFLFADAQQIILKSNDDLVNLIKTRITEFVLKEEERALEEKIKLSAMAPNELLSEIQFVPQATQSAPIKPSSLKQSPKVARPQDAAIIACVSQGFNVDLQTAKQWIMEIDFSVM